MFMMLIALNAACSKKSHHSSFALKFNITIKNLSDKVGQYLDVTLGIDVINKSFLFGYIILLYLIQKHAVL